MEIYESNRGNIARDGYIQRDKQKLIERYQMEVKQLQKEEKERRQKQWGQDNPNEQIYQNMIKRLGNDLSKSSDK